MGKGLLIYMMVVEDARQWSEANRAISISEQYTDCPTTTNPSLKSFTNMSVCCT